jgi:transposase
MAKSRIKRGSRVYVYERENYRDKDGKVKHKKAKYLGIEVTIDGKTEIIPPKKSQKDIEITQSVRYGDIAILYTLLHEFGIIQLLNELIPRRGLPVGEVLASLSINHIIDRETMTMFSKWYQDTALEDFTKITASKLNSTNLGAVMSTTKKLVPEGIVNVCIQIFNKIKHLETGSSALLYDITSTYFYATRIPKVRFGNNKDENDQPQINISLVVTKNEGLPIFFRTYEGNISDVTTIQQLIIDIKRIQFQIEAIILDRGMTSKSNLKALAENQIKFIGGIPLTSNEAKTIVEECEITEKNELIRPSGLVYYEDQLKTYCDIPGRAVVCFNHTDLEQERSTRLKKIAISEEKVARILKSDACNKNADCLETELRAAIKGVSNYFIVTNKDGKVTVVPDEKNRKMARLRDGKCLIFTTDFEKPAPEVISQYFGKDDIEKIFSCFKSWLELQPVRHFDEGHIDVYIFICYLAYLAIALYKNKISANGWEGVKEGLDEMGRIRKTTLTIGGEKIEKLTVFTKEQKDILKKLGLNEELFHK